MYNSQYYTCEQIDQRLLQGYLDDYNTQNNTNLTKAEFLTLLFNTVGRNNTVDNLVTQIGYYECDTAAGTAAKAITVANYNLFAGGSMKVKFVNKNTANNDATLNINNQGAKALYYEGKIASADNSWEAGETVEVYYDGTNFYANNVAGGSGSGDGAFDVSAKYPTSGVEGGNTYTLEGALAVLNANLSASKKKGGMSIKFIQSSDNKYVQYRLMSDTFDTTVANWQGVDDKPIDESDNLVKSGGVKKYIDSTINQFGNTEILNLNLKPYSVMTDGKFSSTATYHACIPVSKGEIYLLKTTDSPNVRYAFATSDTYEAGGSIPLVANTRVISIPELNTTYSVIIPEGCSFLLFNADGGYHVTCYKSDKVITTVEEAIKTYIIELVAISDSGTDAPNVGDVMYNYVSKKLRKRTDTDTMVDVPFKNGAIYSFKDSFWVWDGTNLICKDIIDLTKLSPLPSGEYYQFEEANGNNFAPAALISALSSNIVKRGTIVKIAINSSDNNIFIYTGLGSASYWLNPYNWQRFVKNREFDNLEKSVSSLYNNITQKREISFYNLKPYALTSNGTFGTSDSNSHACIPVKEGETYYLLTTTSPNVRYAFATSDTCEPGGTIPIVTGTSVVGIIQNIETEIQIPSGCQYLLFNAGGNYATVCYKLDMSIDNTETMDMSTVDNLLLVGQSHTCGMGSLKDKSFASYLSALTDWNVVNCASDGHNYIEALSYILNNTMTTGGAYYSDANKHGLCLDFLGGNAENPYFQSGMDGKYAINNMKRFYSTLRSKGYDIIPCGAFGDQPNSISVIQEKVANELGLKIAFIDNECARINQKNFLPYFLWGHFGTRTNAAQYMTLLQALNLPRPNTAIKLYQNRNNVADIDDLLYYNVFDRLKLWKEFSVNHRALLNGNEKYVDRLDIFNSTGTVVNSQYKTIKNGSSVSISDKLLVEIILPCVADAINNTIKISMQLGGSPVVYVRKYFDPSLSLTYEPVPAIFYIPDGVTGISVGDVFSHSLNNITFTVVSKDESLKQIICSASAAFNSVGQTVDVLTRVSDSATFTATSLLKGVPYDYMEEVQNPIGMWEQLGGSGIVTITDLWKYMDYDKITLLIDGATSISNIEAVYDKPKYKKEVVFNKEYLSNNYKGTIVKTIMPNSSNPQGYTLVNTTGNSYYWDGNETVNGNTYCHIPDYFVDKGITQILHLMSEDKITFEVSEFARQTILEDKTSHFKMKIVARYFPASNFNINAGSFTINNDSFDFGRLGVKLGINTEALSVVTNELYFGPSFHYVYMDIHFDAKSTDNVEIEALDDNMELLYIEVVEM